jgi:hypothetical protein
MFVFRDIREPHRKISLFDCCETLRIHIGAELFEQLRRGVADPKPSQTVPEGFQIELQNEYHIDITFNEQNCPMNAEVVIKPH